MDDANGSESLSATTQATHGNEPAQVELKPAGGETSRAEVANKSKERLPAKSGKVQGKHRSLLAGPMIAADLIPGAIEAILLSMDKPVPAARLAESLGLTLEPSAAFNGSESTTGETAGDSGEGAPVESTPDVASSRKTRSRAKSPTAIVQEAIDALNRQYEATGRSFRIQAVAGGFRVMTLPAFSAVLEVFHGKRERHGISRAALETLAIIAYKQPMTRSSLEAIRGVACGEVLRSLIERRLVTIDGRAEDVLGRPMLYTTTRAFLETFGLSSLKDLPTVEEFRSRGVGGVDSDD